MYVLSSIVVEQRIRRERFRQMCKKLNVALCFAPGGFYRQC